MSNNCIFCKIYNNELPNKRVYEDERVVGFVDISPQAKTHLVFIHKNHTSNINEISDNDPSQLVDIFTAISKYTKESGLADYGFRTVMNSGSKAGQTVFHTHVHVLSGEQLGKFGRI